MRQKLIYIVLAVLALLLPLLINLLILCERQFEIVGEATDWLLFWLGYLSFIGTLFMAVVTYHTLLANQKQMETVMESEGAQLVLSLFHDYEYVQLR